MKRRALILGGAEAATPVAVALAPHARLALLVEDAGAGRRILRRVREVRGRARVIAGPLETSADLGARIAEAERALRRPPDLAVLCPLEDLRGPGDPLFSDQRWHRTVARGLRAPWLWLSSLLPMMATEGGAVLIILPRTELPEAPDVAATSAGLRQIARVAARVFAPSGVRVNCLRPGRGTTAEDIAGAALALLRPSPLNAQLVELDPQRW